MTTVAIEIDRSQPTLVIVRFQRGATDDEFAQYISDYTKVLESTKRFGVAFVASPSLPLTPGRHARMQADFIKRYREQIAVRVVAAAFGLPTPLLRGVLRGILLLQPMPCPHTVVANEAEGVAWLKARLWTDHVRRMKNSVPP
jgi:hypothetical protein